MGVSLKSLSPIYFVTYIADDPQETVMVAERSLKTQVLNLIEKGEEKGQFVPQRVRVSTYI